MNQVKKATIVSLESRSICMNRFKLCPHVWFWKLSLGKQSAKPVSTTDACQTS